MSLQSQHSGGGGRKIVKFKGSLEYKVSSKPVEDPKVKILFQKQQVSKNDSKQVVRKGLIIDKERRRPPAPCSSSTKSHRWTSDRAPPSPFGRLVCHPLLS